MITGKSFFDLWALVHLAFWLFAGSTMAALGLRLSLSMLAMLVLATAWEVFERHAEKTWPNVWRHRESVRNAWVSDILMGVLGVWAGHAVFYAQ